MMTKGISMSKLAIGEQVENTGHESGRIVAVFPTVDGTFGYAVDTDGYGACGLFPKGKPAFILTARGTA
jgi:hypothetical protein